MSLGFLLLIDDGDIFIGFLWIIDLGVALIFFIFILHFNHFLHQKVVLNVTNKTLIFFVFCSFFLFSFFYFMANPFTTNNHELQKIWFLLINWYDFYSFYNTFTVTDLNLLRELYFYNNSFEFFLLNFVIFYGIFGAINLTFLIKKFFNFMNFAQIKNFKLLFENNSTLFIRNQNFLRQQNMSTGTRVWSKNKNFYL